MKRIVALSAILALAGCGGGDSAVLGPEKHRRFGNGVSRDVHDASRYTVEQAPLPFVFELLAPIDLVVADRHHPSR